MPEEIKATEEVVETEQKFRGGLGNSLDYLAKTKPEEITGTKTKTKVEETKVDAPKYDYSFFKDLNEDDYKKFEAVKAKDEEAYYNILSNRNEMKKNQRLLSAYQTGKTPDVNTKLAKHEEFIAELRKDGLGAWKRFQTDFDLPEPEFLERQIISGGDVSSRLMQYQETELVPNIEKKFKLEAGSFLYDANDAYKSGTPSYEYRIQTEKKENALSAEFETSRTQQAELAKNIKEQSEADIKYLKDTFFPDSDYESQGKAQEAYTAMLAKLDENQVKIRQGKFTAEENPFSARNIFRGVHFEFLRDAAIKKATADLHKQYNDLGLFLPTKETPTDPTKIKGSDSIIAKQPDSRNQFSPLRRSLIKQ
ncbi:MAG: KOW domain-containing RNA-binding protein [Candidatus Amoebophilus sp.]